MPSVCYSGGSCCEEPRRAAPPVRWSVSRPRVGPSRVVAHRLGPGTPPAVCSTRLSGLLRSPPFCPTGGGGACVQLSGARYLHSYLQRTVPLPSDSGTAPVPAPPTRRALTSAGAPPVFPHRESVYSLLTDLGNVLPSCGTKRASFSSLPAGL